MFVPMLAKAQQKYHNSENPLLLISNEGDSLLIQSNEVAVIPSNFTISYIYRIVNKQEAIKIGYCRFEKGELIPLKLKLIADCQAPIKLEYGNKIIILQPGEKIIAEEAVVEIGLYLIIKVDDKFQVPSVFLGQDFLITIITGS